MSGFRSLNNSTSKRVLNLLEPVKLTVWKVMTERVTVVKLRVNYGGGNGAHLLQDGSVKRRANTTGVPAYLKEHLGQRVPSRQTRSAASPLLSVPRLTTDFARRSFSHVAPVSWNSLPTEVVLFDSERY